MQQEHPLPIEEETVETCHAIYVQNLYNTLDNNQKSMLQKMSHFLMEPIDCCQINMELAKLVGSFSEAEKKEVLDRYFLIRYSIARHWDFIRVHAMILESVLWRRQFQPEKLSFSVIKTLDTTGKLTLLPINARDRENRPILLVRMKMVQLRNNSVDTIEGNLRILVYYAELCRRFSASQALSLIVDLKDTSLLKLDKQLCIDIARTMSSHYPELLGFSIIIHAPTLFSMIWRLLKPVLDERTCNKIVIVNSEPRNIFEAMSQLIPPENIPVQYGGQLQMEHLFNREQYVQEMERLESKFPPSPQN
jgi:hypothetical protein